MKVSTVYKNSYDTSKIPMHACVVKTTVLSLCMCVCYSQCMCYRPAPLNSQSCTGAQLGFEEVSCYGWCQVCWPVTDCVGGAKLLRAWASSPPIGQPITSLPFDMEISYTIRLPSFTLPPWLDWQVPTPWILWNLSFRYILFHEKRLQTMLWHHNARVNHTKDESKCSSAFAFIFGVNWPVQWV